LVGELKVAGALQQSQLTLLAEFQLLVSGTVSGFLTASSASWPSSV
jgi:hypothetical protein